MSTIGTTLFSKIEINGQEVDIATLDANDGIYALPAGQTTANVKFTMIDNTSIPRGVFEENSYITAMTLPDAMTYIASYSFHGVNNINISDKNAILAINPYAFDAEPGPTPPSPSDPDFYFSKSNYEITSGREESMKYKLSNKTGIDTDQYRIQWSSSSADIEVTSQTRGIIQSNVVGATGTITATLSDGTNTHTATCTVSVIAPKQYPTGEWYNNGNPVSSIDVVQGGLTTYTLIFSGTPSDSWIFNDPGQNGISVDTTTGTITITESQLNTSGGIITISAIRSADASYYQGEAYININIQSSGTKTDPDIYFMSPSLTVDYNMEPNKLNGTEVTQGLSGNDASHSAWIAWMTNNSSIATVNHGGYVIAHGNGTVIIAAEYTAHDNYNSKTVQYELTITNYSGGGGKTTPYAHWYENGTELSDLVLVQGGSGTRTLTFSATPSDSWSFMDPMFSGISVDTTNGTITIIEADLNVGNISISANRSEDSSYYYGSANLSIRVLPSGTNPNFYYEQESVNLDNQAMTTSSPMLINNTGFAAMPTYQSADTAIATVDNYGMISFVSAGNTTVTASITDGVDTYTTTINVYCNTMNA